MQPHYYAVHSRLGLRHAPVGTNKLNLGVEAGATAILTPDFLKNHPGTVTIYTFPEPEISTHFYFDTLAEHSQQAGDLITQTLRADEQQIVLGGDHSVTFTALLALQKRVDLRQVGYIQFDAHPDLNTLATSPSDNFHGMYLRAAVAEIGAAEIDSLILPKLPPSNLLFIGNLSFDNNPEEQKFLHNHSITCFSVDQVRQSKEIITKKLPAFIQQFSHIHVSFDIDGMDRSIAPATGIPCQNGLLLSDVTPLLRIIKQAGKTTSFDLVEVNPTKPGAATTITTAQKILATFLEK